MFRSTRSRENQRLRIGPWLGGIDQKAEPYALPPDKLAGGQNLLLDEKPGSALKRQGSLKISTLPSGTTPRDGFTFSNSEGNSYILASDGTNLYCTTDPTQQADWTLLSSTLNPDGFMSFEMAEDKVWMCNGINNVMSWDGTNFVTYDRALVWTQNATSISATTIVSNDLTQADNYWTGQKLVFTTGANQGVVVTITNYVQSTKTLTFTPSLTGSTAVTDQWTMGLIIPICVALRFWDSHLFAVSTVANASGTNFHNLTDPNTGADITIDHPLAWPAANQIDIYSDDGDRLWGVSPVLRDRILFHKSTGIWRLERDPLTIYRPELITREVGSRFPGSWAEKNELLYFLGQHRDGYPDVFKTDMVNIKPVDPSGGIEPTLRAFKQPNAQQRSITLGSASNFQDATLSTLVKYSAGNIDVDYYSSLGQWENNLVTGNNIDIQSTPGVVAVLGSPAWQVRYEGDVLPQNAESPWGVINIPGSGTVATPGGHNLQMGSIGSLGGLVFNKDNLLDSTKDAYLAGSWNMEGYNGANPGIFFALHNGSYAAAFWVMAQTHNPYLYSVGEGITFGPAMGPGANYTFNLLLKANGTYKLWLNGTLIRTGTAVGTALNRIAFGQQATLDIDEYHLVPPNQSINWQYVYFHTNFMGDQLSSFGGGISPSSMPATLPKSGTVTVLNDFTRTPDSLKTVLAKINQMSSLYATCATTSGSITVQLPVGTDYGKFFIGQAVDLRTTTTSIPIANGSNRTITGISSPTITLDAGGGVVTTDSTVGIYPYQGTASLSSWTSSTPDFSSGNDPAGFVSVSNGGVPGSQVLRYQRLQATISSNGYGVGVDLDALTAGILWISNPLFIGSAITSWRTFLDTINVPSGSTQSIKIRAATTTSIPTEGQWGPWLTIANGNNIGTILSDGSPPASTYVQLKVEEGVSATGLAPSVSVLNILWNEGTASELPISGITHKQRYMFCASQTNPSINDTIVVSDRNEAWMFFVGWQVNCLLHFKGLLIGFSSTDSGILSLDVNGLYADQGAAIEANALTREELFKNEELVKELEYSFVHVGPTPGTVNVSYTTPNGAGFSTPKTLTIDGTGRDVKQSFPFQSTAKRFQRLYENNVVGQGMEIRGETIYFDIRNPTNV